MRVEHAGRAVWHLATRGAITACCFVDIAFGLAAALASSGYGGRRLLTCRSQPRASRGRLLRHGLQGVERIVSTEAFANSTTF